MPFRDQLGHRDVALCLEAARFSVHNGPAIQSDGCPGVKVDSASDIQEHKAVYVEMQSSINNRGVIDNVAVRS